MMINLVYIGSDIGDITVNAFNAITDSDIILNYDDIDLSILDEYIKDKEIITTDSDKSKEGDIYSRLEESYSKIEYCVYKSREDKTVTIVSSNNPNIYTVANLLIQISSKHNDIELKIYPGVSPVDYSASLLGAPLNDYAAIDLNNILVSQEELEGKIKSALENDFVLFIHNLKGIYGEEENQNFNLLKRIVNDFNSELLVGIVNGESHEICRFKDINDENINGKTTLIIGNRLTHILDDFMVTSSDYIVKPKFIEQNMDFFERYLKGETPRGLDMECDYLPCHKELEACDFCYCPFYPCADGVTGGEWIKEKNIWSCQFCDWIHLEEPCLAIREGLDGILEETEDLKTKHIELLKMRRQSLLKTLK